MSTFKLPDLGEGLAEAEVLEWHVKSGDRVSVDQPMVSVETAKAVVEVPVPFSGTVTALHAAVGDIVATGAPLIDLDSSTVRGTAPITNADSNSSGVKGTVPINGIHADSSRVKGAAPITGIDSRSSGVRGTAPISGTNANSSTVGGTAPLTGTDSGTVVGIMPATSDDELVESVSIDRARGNGVSRVRAVPLARALAKRLGHELDGIAGSGPDGLVKLDDVILHANIGAAAAAGSNGAAYGSPALRSDAPTSGIAAPLGSTLESLRGPRRAMAHSMSVSRDQVSGSTVCDDADIHSWVRPGDYMLRLIRAMIGACVAEPALNAWYDSANNSRVLLTHVDLAIAVDTPGGLIVPVLRNIQSKTPDELRAAVVAQKDAAHQRSVDPQDLRDFTLMVSNFGTLAGRYGIPLVVPPAVAILGAGKVRQDAVVVAGTVVAHWRMPLSLSFDHRCITGGEACRFLAAVIADLERPD